MDRTLSLLYGNFHMMGYNTVRVSTEGGFIDVMNMIINNELYLIPIVAVESGITAELTMQAADTVRQKLLSVNPEVVSVYVLQLIVTYGGDAQGVINTLFPYWIIDMCESRLMVYESQPAGFLNVRDIVENSLDGRDFSVAEGSRMMNREKKCFPVITAVIVFINILVFIILEAGGSTLDSGYMLDHGALEYSEVFAEGQYYRLFTHFFMHFGVEHLVNNMFVFIVLGYHLENIIGKLQYLIIYMISGFASGIVSVIWYNILGEQCVSAGASGAIFGIIGALFTLIVIFKGRLKDISYRRIIIFLILTLYSGAQNPEVDNVAHVSGFIIGSALMLVIYIFGRKRMEQSLKGDM